MKSLVYQNTFVLKIKLQIIAIFQIILKLKYALYNLIHIHLYLSVHNFYPVTRYIKNFWTALSAVGIVCY